LEQVQTGLAKVPFYPDVMLRRLLLRLFAEGWLAGQHLAGLFRKSLRLEEISLNPAVFSSEPKPRTLFSNLCREPQRPDRC
jgi:hypothetical protein